MKVCDTVKITFRSFGVLFQKLDQQVGSSYSYKFGNIITLLINPKGKGCLQKFLYNFNIKLLCNSIEIHADTLYIKCTLHHASFMFNLLLASMAKLKLIFISIGFPIRCIKKTKNIMLHWVVPGKRLKKVWICTFGKNWAKILSPSFFQDIHLKEYCPYTGINFLWLNNWNNDINQQTIKRINLIYF